MPETQEHIAPEPPPVSAAEARASTTREGARRIAIPLNLTVWRDLPEEYQQQLAWFHQSALNDDLDWEEVAQTIDYDKTTVFRVLKGTYEGSWEKIIAAIRSYRKLREKKAKSAFVEYVPNRIAAEVNWILDYTLTSEGCSMILGEAGVGKTICGKAWCRENNHGRSVFVEAMPCGGSRGLLKQIARQCGVNHSLNLVDMTDSVVRAFNKNRILIIDEIQHHLPKNTSSRPVALELIRRIRDLSGCALVFIGTVRVRQELEGNGSYMYEQITGRTSKPFYLPSELVEGDVLPIVKQFIKRPSPKFMEVMVAWANDRPLGRLRYITEALRFAHRLATEKGREYTEELVYAAHQLRSRKGGAQ